MFTSIPKSELEELIERAVKKVITSNTSDSKIESKNGYLTRKETAALLRISLPTLTEYTKLGYVKSYKVGRRVLYKESEIIQSLERINHLKNKKIA